MRMWRRSCVSSTRAGLSGSSCSCISYLWGLSCTSVDAAQTHSTPFTASSAATVPPPSGSAPPVRKRRVSMGPVSAPPRIPWPALKAKLAREWQAGECVTIVGPRGSGKTHICLHLAELSPYVLFLATKRTDPLIDALSASGYLVTGDLDDVLWTAPHQGDGKPRPLRRKVVYWPRFSDKLSSKARLAAQAHAMSEALRWVDRTGGWTVIVDETMWMTEFLKLEGPLKEIYVQGRTQGVSVIANAQRPTHIPRIAFSSADYLFLAPTGDRRDVFNLREISTGIPGEMIEEGLRQLDRDKHEFLFVDAKPDGLGIVTAPPL